MWRCVCGGRLKRGRVATLDQRLATAMPRGYFWHTGAAHCAEDQGLDRLARRVACATMMSSGCVCANCAGAGGEERWRRACRTWLLWEGQESSSLEYCANSSEPLERPGCGRRTISRCTPIAPGVLLRSHIARRGAGARWSRMRGLGARHCARHGPAQTQRSR